VIVTKPRVDSGGPARNIYTCLEIHDKFAGVLNAHSMSRMKAARCLTNPPFTEYYNTTIQLARAEPDFGARGGALTDGVSADRATTSDGGRTWHVGSISVRATRYDAIGASYAVV